MLKHISIISRILVDVLKLEVISFNAILVI